MKVLVAEDNLFYRRMLEAMLAEWGYEIVPAPSGTKAWEILQQPSAPRIALVNWMMPGMDGLELCRKVRSLDHTAPTYLILLTAKRGKEYVNAAMDSGADDYLVKPFVPEELRMRLQVGQRAVTVQRVAVGAGATGAGEAARPLAAVPPTAEPEVTWNDSGMSVPGYEVLGELGRGGMGVVFKARHVCMNRLVALKVINPDSLAQPDAVRRFYQEVQAAAQLHHPNIVMAHDAGQVGNTHFLSMEFVDGMSLAKMVKQNGPLPIPLACECMRQTALGLQHAHERGMVHRDINPANLLVTNAVGPNGMGTVKILDMGLALLHQTGGPKMSHSELTREGRWFGTVDYMSPEQWTNAHKVDIRADLYSLGCTFYYILTAQVPFPCEGVGEKMLKHHMEDPVLLEKLRPEVPAAVVAIVRKLMAKQPAARFQTPAELADALKPEKLFPAS
jgi:CheY-like chemotaxis protein